MSKKESNRLPTMGTIRLEPTPFSISFRWRDSEVKLTLKNGEDILKVGKLFSDIFSENGIEHTIETEGGLGESESIKENFIDSSEPTSGSIDYMYNWIRKHSGK
jgi:hypothetical protein